MFPPPQPWKQLRPVELDRTYLAFTSRFAVRSWLRVPAFIAATGPIQKQVEAAPGVIALALAEVLARQIRARRYGGRGAVAVRTAA